MTSEHVSYKNKNTLNCASQYTDECWSEYSGIEFFNKERPKILSVSYNKTIQRKHGKTITTKLQTKKVKYVKYEYRRRLVTPQIGYSNNYHTRHHERKDVLLENNNKNQKQRKMETYYKHSQIMREKLYNTQR